MQIRITKHARGDFTVVCGKEYHARLAPDEAAWIVTNLMINGDGGRLGVHTVQHEMQRASRMNSGEFAIHCMSEIVECLREDQRLARIGPLDED